jgi:hypothetical protein
MTETAPTPPPDAVPAAKPTPRWLCPFFQALGLICTALGILGMVIPGLPTTVFLIVALWAFSRSSDRLKLWLWTHPKFGPGVRAWHEHGVIPVKAKISAITVMSVSLLILVLIRESWTLPTIVGAVMVPIALWICTRRGEAPT